MRSGLLSFLSCPRVRRYVAVVLLLAGGLMLPHAGLAHGGIPGEENECPCCITPHRVKRLMSRTRGRSHTETVHHLQKVGFLSLPGFNADIWEHNGYAYLGSEGTGRNLGVAVVDVRKPAKPRLLGRVAAIPNTTAEDVMVVRADTPFFHGELLATGIQAKDYDTPAPHGVDLWDVTNPTHPKHLAFWEYAHTEAGPARGVHELYLFARGNHAYVAAMVPDAEEYEQMGDFRLLDVTDPAHPVLASSWSAFTDGGFSDDPDSYPWGHSVTVNEAGTIAITSWWNAGTLFLDILDPAHPRLVNRIAEASGPLGRTHSCWLARNESVLLVNNENLEPVAGSQPWGRLHLWDIRNPGSAVELGEYATPNCAHLPARRNGIFTVHNSVVRGDTAFLSWFSDGIRVVDFSEPTAPREVASFVPSGADVWGVSVDQDLVFASDIGRGLYVLRYR